MRLYVASGGYLRYTMRVIKSAARKAMKLKLNEIDDAVLVAAFDAEIGASGFVKFNPFTVNITAIENEIIGGKKNRHKGASSNRIKSKKKDEAGAVAELS
ncbi:MAG: hypothetical protein IPP88_02355 [Betaproteobacteria bacterium]|nr:hypothetical protein [Betaproteobacteria bacterium]